MTQEEAWIQQFAWRVVGCGGLRGNAGGICTGKKLEGTRNAEVAIDLSVIVRR
jgi:hypothetical protein